MISSPLFGRHDETTWIDQAISRAAAGRGGAAFLVGPPGLGKTRLVELAAELAGGRDLTVAIGRCWETGGAPAGWPLVEALRAWRHRPELAAAVDELGASRAQLRHLHPELVASPEAPTFGEPDASVRFLVFDAVTELWRELARRRPCLLVLEDLHAADRFTAELLAMLCRRASDVPLLVLGTYRAREARLAEEVQDALAQATRAAHVLELRPLARTDAEHLARDALGSQSTASAVQRIVEACDGNPLFVKELARSAGRDAPARGLGGLDHAIAGHLSTLHPAGRDVAEIAAIFGRRVDPGLLRRTCRDALELDDAALTAALAELADRELLVSEDDGRLAFVHILVRDALYARLSATRREALHAAAVPHLEQIGAPASQLAHHALAAGPALPAQHTIALARRAVAQAAATLAFLDAATILERLVGFAEGVPGLAPEALLELRLELAEAQVHAGHVSAGRDLAERVATTARAIGHAELQARAALAYGAEFTRGARNRIMIGLLEQALDALGEELTPLRVRVLARYSAALFPAQDPEVPVRVAEQAIALARKLGDRRTLADVLHFSRLPLTFWYPIRTMLPLEHESMELAREVGSVAELSRALGLGALAQVAAGEPDVADGLIAEAFALAESTQSPQLVFRLYLLHAMMATRRGEFGLAGDRLSEARACTERGPVEAAIPVFVLSRFGSARLRRDLAELSAMRDEVETVLATMPNSAAILAAYYSMIGEGGPARAAIGRRDADLRGRPLAVYVSLTEAALLLGELELVRELYARLTPFADDVVTWGLMGFTAEGVAHGWLARLAEALGHPDDADRHFARAAELDERSGARPALANVLEDWAAALTARSGAEDRRRAAALLDRAAALLDEIGLHARAEAARARQAALGEAVPPPRTPRPGSNTAASLELRRDGDVFVVTFGCERFSARDSKGLRYLEILVRAPGSEIHALELIGAEVGPEARAAFGGDAGPLLDPQAKAAYRERVRALQEELTEAEDFGDLARTDRLRAELDAIVQELTRAMGLAGRDRAGVSPAERARINVQRRLKAAVSALAKHSRALDEHLARALRTGTFCRYDPPANP